jgi:hypothetical protein
VSGIEALEKELVQVDEAIESTNGLDVSSICNYPLAMHT